MVRANCADPASLRARRSCRSASRASSRSSGRRSATRTCRGSPHELREAIGDADVTCRPLGMFGNPLEDGELDRADARGLEGADRQRAPFRRRHWSPASPAACAASRSTDSLPRFKEVWGELARRAADKGVRIAFENCAMDGNWATGDWNIAHNPDAWELMFNELPDDNLGLEWEPCHQLVYLIDPLPQIRKWAHEDLPRPRQGRDGALGRDPRARHLRQG